MERSLSYDTAITRGSPLAEAEQETRAGALLFKRSPTTLKAKIINLERKADKYNRYSRMSNTSKISGNKFEREANIEYLIIARMLTFEISNIRISLYYIILALPSFV